MNMYNGIVVRHSQLMKPSRIKLRHAATAASAKPVDTDISASIVQEPLVNEQMKQPAIPMPRVFIDLAGLTNVRFVASDRANQLALPCGLEVGRRDGHRL